MATKVTTGLITDNAITDAKLSETITATTQSASDNSTSVATTAYVTTAIANLADSAPSTLNTLNELAAALGDDANFSTTVTNSIATKLPLAGGTLTGNLAISTSSPQLFLETGSSHYNWQIAAQENINAGLEISSGNQDADVSGDTFTPRLVVLQSGNVGIGTQSPDTLLTVQASGASAAKFLGESGPHGLLVGGNDAGFGYIGHVSSGDYDLTIDSSGRVGLNQAPAATNFTLQVTGRVTDGTDGRAAYFKGHGTQTSIGSTGPTVVIQNANTTTNNYAKLSWESSGGGETISINAQNIDHTNHYGDMAFNTRGSGGYSEKMRITSNGHVSIGMGSNSTGYDSHKFMVNTDASNGTVGSTGFVHFGPISGTSNANGDGYLSGISLGYHENNNSYKHTAIAVRAHGDSAARRDMLFLVNTASEAASAQLSDAKITISSGTGQVTVGNTAGISDNYIFKVLTGNGYGQQGSHNGTYYHHETDRSYFYWNEAGYFNGGAHTYSDESLKKDVTLIPNALDSVAKMNGVTFNWKDPENRGGKETGKGKQFGVIAQNMLEVDPELPTLSVDPLADAGNEETDDKLYSMDYSRLSPYFIEAIKELKEKLEAAEARITELEG